MRFLFLILVLWVKSSWGQTNDQLVIQVLSEKDSLFWVGYNSCDLNLMSDYLMPDMKFYHDQAGIIEGVEGMRSAMEQSICSDPKNKVRREVVPGSFNIYLLKNAGEVYAAVATGEYTFSNSYDGAAWNRNSSARFHNLWFLESGEWRMQTIYSFDHRDSK